MDNEKKFIRPECEIINLYNQDIITDSEPGEQLGGDDVNDLP